MTIFKLIGTWVLAAKDARVERVRFKLFLAQARLRSMQQNSRSFTSSEFVEQDVRVARLQYSLQRLERRHEAS